MISASTTVGCHIPSFSYNTTTILTNDEARVNVLTNYTVMGSEIQVFCGNQTNQDGTGPTFMAVCGENGTWLPDLSGHKCATNQDSSDSEFNNASWFAQTPHYALSQCMYCMKFPRIDL